MKLLIIRSPASFCKVETITSVEDSALTPSSLRPAPAVVHPVVRIDRGVASESNEKLLTVCSEYLRLYR